MKMMRSAALAATALAALASPALAGGVPCQGDCYEKVVSPPVYDTVNELHVARQGYSVNRIVPPQVETVNEPIVVRPSRTVAKVFPARYGIVDETVQVSPPKRVWQVSIGPDGREIGCWVEVPARFDVVPRKVLVKPEQVSYVTIPEEVRVVRRTVVTSPGRVERERVPTVYETRARTVEVAPARADWVPVSAAGYAGAQGYGAAPVAPPLGGGYGPSAQYGDWAE